MSARFLAAMALTCAKTSRPKAVQIRPFHSASRDSHLQAACRARAWHQTVSIAERGETKFLRLLSPVFRSGDRAESAPERLDSPNNGFRRAARASSRGTEPIAAAPRPESLAAGWSLSIPPATFLDRRPALLKGMPQSARDGQIIARHLSRTSQPTTERRGWECGEGGQQRLKLTTGNQARGARALETPQDHRPGLGWPRSDEN